MFDRLKYKVRFDVPDRTLEGDVSFGEGLTAIVGPNGKGKSLILEMFQYALFGSAALRGKADDYKELSVEAYTTIKQVQYFIARSKSAVMLSQVDGDNLIPQATGTKPVNLAVIKLLGYSYDVFKVANLAEQGCIEKLGDMLPTARKRLVDETIGLTALDALDTFISKETTSVAATVKALEPVVVEPVVPVRAEGLGEVQLYQAQQSALADLSNQRAVLLSKLLLAPVEPVKVSLEADDEKLTEYQEIYDATLALDMEGQILLRQRSAIPAVLVVEEVALHAQDSELENLQRYTDEKSTHVSQLAWFRAEYAKIPVAEYGENQLVVMEKNIKLVQDWCVKQQLLEERVPHDCPACEHHWEDEDPRIKTEYAHVPDKKPECTSPLNMKQITEQRQKLMFLPRQLELQEQIRQAQHVLETTYVHGYEETIRAIHKARVEYHAAETSRNNAKKLADINAELERILTHRLALPDHVADIKRIKDAREAHRQYLLNFQVYTLAKEAYDKAAEALMKLPTDLNEQIEANSSQLMLAIQYEANMLTYNKLKSDFDKLSEQLEEQRLNLLDWQNGKKAVVELRARVKGYIIPSLNMVASKLLNEMTGGELSWLVISEDFDIVVEGQRLETLSGAGKGVANLALRLALGQVLTNAVFPSVMLDEIDASFDNERAAYTATCLRRLTSIFKQVIQISHKEGIEADNYVRL